MKLNYLLLTRLWATSLLLSSNVCMLVFHRVSRKIIYAKFIEIDYVPLIDNAILFYTGIILFVAGTLFAYCELFFWRAPVFPLALEFIYCISTCTLFTTGLYIFYHYVLTELG